MARESKSTPGLHLHCSLIYFMKLMFYNEERWGFLIGTDGLKLDRSNLIGRVEGCFIQRAGKCLSGTCHSVRLEKQKRRTGGLGHQRENAISSFSFQSDVPCYCSELHLKFRSNGWCGSRLMDFQQWLSLQIYRLMTCIAKLPYIYERLDESCKHSCWLVVVEVVLKFM